MASEFFAEGGNDVAITLTPGENGILQVHVDGKKIFDKEQENSTHPNLPRVKEMRTIIRERLSVAIK